MAGFDPTRIDAVARLPYALTLWTYWQRQESEHREAFATEDGRIDLAHMVTLGFINGTGPMIQRRNNLISRYSAPVEGSEIAQMARDADDLYAQHDRARKGLVS